MTKNWFLGILVVHLQDPTGGEAEVVVGVGIAQDHDRLRAIVSILSEYLYLWSTFKINWSDVAVYYCGTEFSNVIYLMFI